MDFAQEPVECLNAFRTDRSVSTGRGMAKHGVFTGNRFAHVRAATVGSSWKAFIRDTLASLHILVLDDDPIPAGDQGLREKRLGRVVVSTILDRPWSQYYCYRLYGNAEFVRKYPAAAKRAARAILKATDICALETARVARALVDKEYAPRFPKRSPPSSPTSVARRHRGTIETIGA